MRTRDQLECGMNIVGDRVIAKRCELKLKQKDVVEALENEGVSITLSGYSKLEGKLRRVTDYELVALATVFNVSIAWLCGLE